MTQTTKDNIIMENFNIKRVISVKLCYVICILISCKLIYFVSAVLSLVVGFLRRLRLTLKKGL